MEIEVTRLRGEGSEELVCCQLLFCPKICSNCICKLFTISTFSLELLHKFKLSHKHKASLDEGNLN